MAKLNSFIGKAANRLVQTKHGKRTKCYLPAKHGKTLTHSTP